MSMAVLSSGAYDVPKDIVYSFPVRITADRTWEIVQGLSISDFARDKMEKTAQELVEEKKMALDFLEGSASS